MITMTTIAEKDSGYLQLEDARSSHLLLKLLFVN